MIEKRLKYHKLLFSFIFIVCAGFFFLFFQKGVVLAGNCVTDEDCYQDHGWGVYCSYNGYCTVKNSCADSDMGIEVKEKGTLNWKENGTIGLGDLNHVLENWDSYTNGFSDYLLLILEHWGMGCS